jgi:hypothetical protein
MASGDVSDTEGKNKRKKEKKLMSKLQSISAGGQAYKKQQFIFESSVPAAASTIIRYDIQLFVYRRL